MSYEVTKGRQSGFQKKNFIVGTGSSPPRSLGIESIFSPFTRVYRPAIIIAGFGNSGALVAEAGITQSSRFIH